MRHMRDKSDDFSLPKSGNDGTAIVTSPGTRPNDTMANHRQTSTRHERLDTTFGAMFCLEDVRRTGAPDSCCYVDIHQQAGISPHSRFRAYHHGVRGGGISTGTTKETCGRCRIQPGVIQRQYSSSWASVNMRQFNTILGCLTIDR